MEIDKIIIPSSCYNEIVEHGKSNLPYEVCGLLSGNNNKVQSVWKLKNEIKSDRRFFVGKKIIEETLLQMAKHKEKVIAIYHSHPTTAAIPSSYDIANHLNLDVIMIIISYKTNNPKVKCYRVQTGTYKTFPFSIEPTS
ncbi:M67 family metallopeptidase [Halalkalibacter alkalisediminis]|uniref:M67 family metallopeptidase n=1 Tax=Halalkalibacter alkalisediminis TaxID=935616 RepID=A0ABV6NMI1_9BACI|nr:M67 family metallopeptidase [Halalkalibacter alkalisediminis]